MSFSFYEFFDIFSIFQIFCFEGDFSNLFSDTLSLFLQILMQTKLRDCMWMDSLKQLVTYFPVGEVQTRVVKSDLKV
jgi:hypothetical protein